MEVISFLPRHSTYRFHFIYCLYAEKLIAKKYNRSTLHEVFPYSAFAPTYVRKLRKHDDKRQWARVMRTNCSPGTSSDWALADPGENNHFQSMAWSIPGAAAEQHRSKPGLVKFGKFNSWRWPATYFKVFHLRELHHWQTLWKHNTLRRRAHSFKQW